MYHIELTRVALTFTSLHFTQVAPGRGHAHLQLIVLFLVLPGVSTTIFRTFLCDDGFVEDKSVSFLEADLTLSCESKEYNRLAAHRAGGARGACVRGRARVRYQS